MTIINDKAGGRTRERFFQLSEDLSTLRWSWTNYLLVLEITEIR